MGAATGRAFGAENLPLEGFPGAPHPPGYFRNEEVQTSEVTQSTVASSSDNEIRLCPIEAS